MEIPDTVMEAVIAAEAERKSNPSVSKSPTPSKKKLQTKKVVKILEKAKAPVTVEAVVEQIKEPAPTPMKIVTGVAMEIANNIAQNIGKNILQSALDKTINKINSLLDKRSRRFELNKVVRPTLYRQGSYLAKGAKDSQLFVNTAELLMELFTSIKEEEIYEEDRYCGGDKKYCKVYRAMLPEGYIASVCAIAIRDLPNQVVESGDIKIVPKNSYDVEPVCETAQPMLTDTPQMKSYNCLTVKILNEDGTIKSWMPGKHPSYKRPNSMLDTFCIVGIRWNR